MSCVSLIYLFGLCVCLMLLGLYMMFGMFVWVNRLVLVLYVILCLFWLVVSVCMSCVIVVCLVVLRLGVVVIFENLIVVFGCLCSICGSSVFCVYVLMCVKICLGLRVGRLWNLKLKWYLVGIVLIVLLFWIVFVCVVVNGMLYSLLNGFLV